MFDTSPFLGTSNTYGVAVFSSSTFSYFHCNAMRKGIKAHKNLHTNQENEETQVRTSGDVSSGFQEEWAAFPEIQFCKVYSYRLHA